MPGTTEALFWASTPRQTHRLYQAFERRQRREHNDRAWLAHTTAALHRASGRMPPLSKLQLGDAPRRRTVSDPDDMLALVKMMNAALGGDVVEAETIPMA